MLYQDIPNVGLYSINQLDNIRPQKIKNDKKYKPKYKFIDLKDVNARKLRTTYWVIFKKKNDGAINILNESHIF